MHIHLLIVMKAFIITITIVRRLLALKLSVRLAFVFSIVKRAACRKRRRSDLLQPAHKLEKCRRTSRSLYDDDRSFFDMKTYIRLRASFNRTSQLLAAFVLLNAVFR